MSLDKTTTGSVSSKNHYDIEFPKGHIAIKSFDAELVDEVGKPLAMLEYIIPQFFGMGAETRKTAALLILMESRLMQWDVLDAGIICNFCNVTEDEYGRSLKPDYDTVAMMEDNANDSVAPLKVFIFDVTDTWQNTGTHDCLIEYDIEQYSTKVADNDHITTKRSSVRFPDAGDVIMALHVFTVAE
ncbi:hypothetical protein CTI12_AA429820 [Artemisia annua]|uniref:Uncharacterized protein n=1 Tax=Artemisia annua TaxID=35608 RepID=A0A2U1M239_ARTAN|nr:hypothetical protein CTI12_AA429820 [Artemisia annua]